jgi:transposase InsO family protein
MAGEAVGIARSTYYYCSHFREADQLLADLQEVAGKFPIYGTRRVTHQLCRFPYQYRVNRKHIQRLMRQKKLLQPLRQAKCTTTKSDHPYPRYANLVEGLEVVRPEQVWVSDITYIRLGQGFVYLAIVMDVFTRAIRGWNLSRLLDMELTLKALKQGLSLCIPKIHHSDQGVHYASSQYTDLLSKYQIRISMSKAGKPEENGYAERLMRTIKEEEVNLSDYQDFDDAYRQIGRFIENVYMTKRIHSALGYLTPVEFELAYRQAQLEQTIP